MDGVQDVRAEDSFSPLSAYDSERQRVAEEVAAAESDVQEAQHAVCARDEFR